MKSIVSETVNQYIADNILGNQKNVELERKFSEIVASLKELYGEIEANANSSNDDSFSHSKHDFKLEKIRHDITALEQDIHLLNK
jgi:hypothetical protein